MEIILKGIIIGIIEGITEFLPVSSTAHISLLAKFVYFKDELLSLFTIVTQLGAGLAVIYTYRNKIIKSLRNMGIGKWGFKFWIIVLAGFYPSVIAGSVFGSFIENNLLNLVTVGMTLINGAILLLIIENKLKNTYKIHSIDDIKLGDSLKIGFISCILLVPGMSRSAAVMIGSMLNGISVSVAAEFSFFIAIPAIYSSIAYAYRSLPMNNLVVSNLEVFSLCLSFVISFIISLFTIKKFIQYLENKSLKPFVIYRVLLGSIILALAYLGIV
jgi:undecaprenyl-diphosphatase